MKDRTDDGPPPPSGDSPAGGKLRVLIVDDDPLMLRIMEATLGVEMEVTACASGLQALTALRRQIFEVVCSDYLMPGIDGLAVLRAAVETQEDASCLLVTAGADRLPEMDRKRYYVLQKPFHPERLLGLVAQLGRIARMKRSVKVSASKVTALPERPSTWPPPSSSRTRNGGSLP